jgi:hypothetical protein
MGQQGEITINNHKRDKYSEATAADRYVAPL